MGCGDEQGPIQPATSKLVFKVQPTNAAGAQTITPALQVAVQDALGNMVTTATDTVTLALASSPGVGTLSGTLRVAATQGVATFNDVWIDRPGTYTLAARSGGRDMATSVTFAVTLTFTAIECRLGPHLCGDSGGPPLLLGVNQLGELGDGTTIDRLTPVLVAGGLGFAAVIATNAPHLRVHDHGGRVLLGSK